MPGDGVASVVALDGPPLAASDLDALVEIAFLAIRHGGDIRDDARVGFRAVVARLRGLAFRAVRRTAYRTTLVASPREISDRELDALLDELDARLDHASLDERLDACAARLSPELRGLAYKIVYGLALADLAWTKGETRFAAQVAAALEIERDRVDALIDETMAALGAVRA